MASAPGHSDHSIVYLTDGRLLAMGINTSLAGTGAAMVESYDPFTGQWTMLSSPSLKRMQCEVVYLPDGNVLAATGDKTNQVTTEPVKSCIVKRSDIYDPRTDRWRRIADMLGFREYHAVTLLLPDGLVSTTGGTVIKFQNPPVNGDIEGYSLLMKRYEEGLEGYTYLQRDDVASEPMIVIPPIEQAPTPPVTPAKEPIAPTSVGNVNPKNGG